EQEHADSEAEEAERKRRRVRTDDDPHFRSGHIQELPAQTTEETALGRVGFLFLLFALLPRVDGGRAYDGERLRLVVLVGLALAPRGSRDACLDVWRRLECVVRDEADGRRHVA